MPNTEKTISQFEGFMEANSSNLEDAKEAFFHKDWKLFCQTIKPILQSAEDLNMMTKGTASQVYNSAIQSGNNVYIKASYLAAENTKSFVENAQKMSKHCGENTKLFFDDLKKLSLNVFKSTKDLIHKATHEAHTQGKKHC